MLLLLRIFIPFAFAYLLAYLVRVVNAVAGPPIRLEFGLTDADLGLLTSVYFFGFAVAQLPFGVLMDRYGPRRVEALTFSIAVLGCMIFAMADGLGMLTLGRLLIGVGCALALMAPFTAYRQFFTPERYSLVVGVHMACGAFGAALGGGPAEVAVQAAGWSSLFMVLAVALGVSAVAIFFVVPKGAAAKNPAPAAGLIRDIGRIYASRRFWCMAPLTSTAHIGMLSIVTLWTGPWLLDVADLTPSASGTWLTLTALAMLVGFLISGVMFSRAERRGLSMHVFVIGMMLHLCVTVLLIVLPADQIVPLWLAYALTGSVAVFSYGIITSSFAPELAGRVNTALNFVVFCFAFLAQWVFGVILDAVPGAAETGYDVALGVQVAVTLLGLLNFMLLRPRPALDAAQA